MNATFAYPKRIETSPGTWKTVGTQTVTTPVLDSRHTFYGQREVLIDNPMLRRRHWITVDERVTIG